MQSLAVRVILGKGKGDTVQTVGIYISSLSWPYVYCV